MLKQFMYPTFLTWCGTVILAGPLACIRCSVAKTLGMGAMVQIDDKVIEKPGGWKVIKTPYGKDTKRAGTFWSLWEGTDGAKYLTLAPAREAGFSECSGRPCSG